MFFWGQRMYYEINRSSLLQQQMKLLGVVRKPKAFRRKSNYIFIYLSLLTIVGYMHHADQTFIIDQKSFFEGVIGP